MNDFILFMMGVAATLLVQHFWPKKGQGVSIPSTLDGFGQILSHEGQALVARFDAFEASLPSNLERFKAMLIDALNELKAAADAKEAAAVAAAKAEAAAPAAATQEATDEQAVRDFTAANFPAP
jgi:hypothetical protein